MAWSITINGKTFTDTDFAPYGFVEKLPELINEFLTYAASQEANAQATLAAASAGQAAAQAAAAATSAASASSSRAAAQAAVGQVTVGSTSALSFPLAAASLATASDVVAVHVYDTRLDSDGGAWTERCQHTSWFAETLNTSIRGARRAFPKVAIIVARFARLDIYDALDLAGSGVPRLWMRFDGATNSVNMLIGGNANSAITGILGLNGKLYISDSNSAQGGLQIIDFTQDRSLKARVAGAATGQRGLYRGGIAQRNAGLDYDLAPWTSILVGASAANGVHARVLPGAPLDAAGLPIPTIVVPTTNGLTVIHPEWRSSAVTIASGYSGAMFWGDNTIAARRIGQLAAVEVGPVPYATTTANTAWRRGAMGSVGTLPVRALAYTTHGLHRSLAPRAIGTDSEGVALFDDSTSLDMPQNMVARIATYAATGWMPGDCRLAALCYSDTGSAVAGSELIANGDFSGGTTGWTPNELSGLAVVSGALEVSVSVGQAFAAGVMQNFSVVAGRTYLIRGRVERVSGRQTVIAEMLSPAPASVVVTKVVANVNGWHNFQFVWRAEVTGTARFRMFENAYPGATGLAFRCDDISCTEQPAPDFSGQGGGLRTIGTLTRAAVASGASLAAWSGFSASNYLEQENYGPDSTAGLTMDFGTGDFCVAVWVNPGANPGSDVLERGNPAASTNRWALRFISGVPRFLVADDTNTSTVDGVTDVRGTAWVHLVAVRRAGAMEIWVNGRMEGRVGAPTASGTVTNASGVLRVGVNRDLTSVFAGSIAMLRISRIAPAPAQITRMFADERVLFQPGAQAFLGGTSNAIGSVSFSEFSRRYAVLSASGVSMIAGLARADYADNASASPAIGTGSLLHVAMEGGVEVFATNASVGARRGAVVGLDRLPGNEPRSPIIRKARASAVTLDATPVTLAPRVFVGEGELLAVEWMIVGRVVGGVDGQRLSYRRRGTFYRDLGGNVTLQGSVQAVGTDTEVTGTADATLVVDTTAQTCAPQVTGVAATAIEWEALLLSIERLGAGRYEEVA